MKKRRGYFCRIYGRWLPNEKFSAKGHGFHICEECSQMPKEEREVIEQEEKIFQYLWQSHISNKNMARLKELTGS